MKFLKKIFCSHESKSELIREDRGCAMMGLVREYKYTCKKCGKVEWSNYENMPPLGWDVEFKL